MIKIIYETEIRKDGSKREESLTLKKDGITNKHQITFKTSYGYAKGHGYSFSFTDEEAPILRDLIDAVINGEND